MSASTSSLDLTQLKLQARELRDEHRDGDTSTYARLREHLTRTTHSTDAEIREYDVGLREAQFVIARENGFESWAAMKLHLEADSDEGSVDTAWCPWTKSRQAGSGAGHSCLTKRGRLPSLNRLLSPPQSFPVNPDGTELVMSSVWRR